MTEAVPRVDQGGGPDVYAWIVVDETKHGVPARLADGMIEGAAIKLEVGQVAVFLHQGLAHGRDAPLLDRYSGKDEFRQRLAPGQLQQGSRRDVVGRPQMKSAEYRFGELDLFYIRGNNQCFQKAVKGRFVVVHGCSGRPILVVAIRLVFDGQLDRLEQQDGTIVVPSTTSSPS